MSNGQQRRRGGFIPPEKMRGGGAGGCRGGSVLDEVNLSRPQKHATWLWRGRNEPAPLQRGGALSHPWGETRAAVGRANVTLSRHASQGDVTPLAVELNDAGGVANDGAVRGHVVRHDAVVPNDDIIAYGDATNDASTSRDKNIIPYRWNLTPLLTNGNVLQATEITPNTASIDMDIVSMLEVTMLTKRHHVTIVYNCSGGAREEKPRVKQVHITHTLVEKTAIWFVPNQSVY